MNKCEELKFSHAWEDVTPNIVYPTNPPQYPPRQEKCVNCGLVRTFREKRETFVEYSDGKARQIIPEDSITISNLDLTGNGTPNLTNLSSSIEQTQ